MNMKTLLFSLFLTLSFNATASSPQWRTVTNYQKDGTTLVLTRMANGRFCICQTADGIALIKGADGNYYYAEINNGVLEPASLLAHEMQKRTTEENAWLTQNAVTADEAIQVLNAFHPLPSLLPQMRSAASTEDGLGKYGQSALGTVESIGQPIIPVVMVEFADVSFQDTITTTKLSRFFNEEGYHDESLANASVRDFFVDQSQGLFSPTFEVVCKVKVSQNRAYYGANGSDGSLDVNGKLFVAEALSEAEKTVDFSTYATNGHVPLVAIFYAGPGEHSSFEAGCEDYLWAKFDATRFATNDGKVIFNSYLMANELFQNYSGTAFNPIVTSANLDGIGLFSHEFGHALGLPDLYYTGSNSTISDTLKTMDYWSIMDYGQYYMNGYMPTGYTAYERSNLGWLDVKELKDAQFAKLYPYGRESEGATAYILRNPDDEREYYLLENRQKGTFYPKRMGYGMLITHVDYLYAKWAGNAVNNDPEHQRLAYVPADNVKDGTTTITTVTDLFNGYKGDLFPGSTNATSFTDDTTPAATLFNGEKGKLGLPLYNIALNSDSVITFSFIDPTQTAIVTAENSPSNLNNVSVYTLTGVRVNNIQSAPAGIYILSDGRKLWKR